MPDHKKPCSHLDDCWTYGMTALSRRVWERQKMQNNADEREIFYPDRAGRVVDQGIVAAARRPGKNWASVAEFVRKMKEDGASAADIETITRALLGDMG